MCPHVKTDPAIFTKSAPRRRISSTYFVYSCEQTNQPSASYGLQLLTPSQIGDRRGGEFLHVYYSCHTTLLFCKYSTSYKRFPPLPLHVVVLVVKQKSCLSITPLLFDAHHLAAASSPNATLCPNPSQLVASKPQFMGVPSHPPCNMDPSPAVVSKSRPREGGSPIAFSNE